MDAEQSKEETESQDRQAELLDLPTQLTPQHGNADATKGDACLPLTRPSLLQDEHAKEDDHINGEIKLSKEEVTSLQKQEIGEVDEPCAPKVDETAIAEQEQKNWGEFGYDLDCAETTNEVVLTDPKPLNCPPSGSAPLIDEKVNCEKHAVALEIAQDLNQMLEKKGSSGASTTTTVTSSRIESITIPSGEAVEKADKCVDDSPSDEGTQLQNTFDAFLSDDDEEDTLIADIWDGTNHEKTGKKTLQYPTVQTSRVPSSSGDSSEHALLEHGSTLFGLRTRNLIWTAAVIFCSAILVVCLSLIIAEVTNDDETSEFTSRPPLPETIDLGDFVTPTVPRSPLPSSNEPGVEVEFTTTDTTPIAPVSTDATSTEATTSTLQEEDDVEPTSTVSNICGDFDGILFFVNGMSRNCAWLRGNTSVDFQRSICEWNEPIRSNCRATCETCDDYTSPITTPSPITPPTMTTSSTMSSVSGSSTPAAPCPPDLLGNIPGETITCLWLSRVNEAYRAIQCTEELTREHCPATCQTNCGTVE
jgi:hypothetical protein